jgi:nicotinamidase-related amidase
MNTALILVDIQQDYFPRGKNEVVGAIDAGGAATRLLSHFREKNLPIVHVQHISLRHDATFFLPDTDGVNFYPTVTPLPGEKIIQKHFPNSFRNTDLAEHLEGQGIKKLIICGMMSHMCIDATIRAAFDLGYACLVAHDACATKNLFFGGREIAAAQVHGAFMAALSAVYAKVLTVEEIIGII